MKQILRQRTWMPAAGRIVGHAALLALMAMALSQQAAFAVAPGSSATLDAISKKILEVLAQLAGLVATIGGVVVGVRVIYSAMMGSPRAISEGITALVAVAFGIAMVASGPQLARYIYNAI